MMHLGTPTGYKKPGPQRGQMFIGKVIVEYTTPKGSNLCLNLIVREVFIKRHHKKKLLN